MATYADNTRDCKGCNRRLPISAFWFENKAVQRRHYRCKQCHGKYIRDWLTDHQENRRRAVQTYYRRHGIRFRRYGITKDQYDQMVRYQGNVCAICGKGTENDRPLDIDHDATTGIIRGLLCNSCNTGIGKLGHDPIRLASAARYIIRTSNKPAVL